MKYFLDGPKSHDRYVVVAVLTILGVVVGFMLAFWYLEHHTAPLPMKDSVWSQELPQ